MREFPTWLVTEYRDEDDLGVVTTGKEAQINLIERHGHDGRSCVFARKRYLPREVKQKGELRALGVQRSSAFVHDVEYREGRQFRKSRDRRAVERMSTYGKRLLQDRWMGHEHEVMTRLWHAGVSVPYPIAHDGNVYDLEFLGDDASAAPQLQSARLHGSQLHGAFEQVLDGLHRIVGEGYAHADLSAYNLLWWEGRVWFIDFPQAVDIAANPQGVEFLHRDVLNICGWFAQHGFDVDAEEVFADVLGSL